MCLVIFLNIEPTIVSLLTLKLRNMFDRFNKIDLKMSKNKQNGK